MHARRGPAAGNVADDRGRSPHSPSNLAARTPAATQAAAGTATAAATSVQVGASTAADSAATASAAGANLSAGAHTAKLVALVTFGASLQPGGINSAHLK